MAIDIDSVVDDIMRERPATIRIFLDYRMNCVGCPIAAFHTIEDSCREHGVNADQFVEALRAAAGLGNIPHARPRRAATVRRG